MKEEIKIKCPFCDKGYINSIYTPSIRKEVIKRGSAINKRSFRRSKEKYEVLESCPQCDASSKKIEKALNSGGDYKRPSRESVLERMKKAGLSTRI